MAHLILIPRFGLMGAAAGRLIGDMVTLTVAAWSLRAHLRPGVLGFAAVAILAGICLTGMLELTAHVSVPWFVALALSGPAVLGCVLLVPRVRSELALLTV
jgi:O-antigen/teichoic acid export membrane protein